MSKKMKQTIIGRVVAAKTPKTVVVLIERKKMHALYKKAFKRSKKYLVHDNLGAKSGDLVEIVKVRPISKNKHFQVQKIVGKNMEAIIIGQLKEEAAEAIAEVMPEEKTGELSAISPQTEEKIDKKIKKVTKRKEKSDSRKLKTDG